MSRGLARGSLRVACAIALLSGATSAGAVCALDEAERRGDWTAPGLSPLPPASRGIVERRASAAGAWTIRRDARTGRVSLASGVGATRLPSGAGAAIGELEAAARAFVAAEPDLFRIPHRVTLALDPARSGDLDQGRLHRLTFRLVVDGVEVEGASVFFRWNAGRLVQFGTARLSDALSSAPTFPGVGSAHALDAARRLLAPAGTLAPLDEDTLVLLPVDDAASGLDVRLAWRHVVRAADGSGTWLVFTDARSGEPLWVRDLVRHACPVPAAPRGRVVGGVLLGPVEGGVESRRELPFAQVAQDGADGAADANGAFAWSGAGPAAASLGGTTFAVDCQGCVKLAAARATRAGPGLVDMGIGGIERTGNGSSTRPERNAYYHANRARRLATRYLTDAQVGGFFGRRLPLLVNRSGSCNATWDGTSIRLLASDADCNNTADIAEVVSHEWGHALDDATGPSADTGTGEGIADVVAFLLARHPRAAPFLYRGDGAGIRNADEDVAGLKTLAGLDTACPGRESHCVGELLGQTLWHLARNLRTSEGDEAGWQLAERLFFLALPLADTYLPDQPGSLYDAIVAVDDDDGDLGNGVPHGDEIDEAFTHHGLASAPLALDSGSCAAPAAPAVAVTLEGDLATGLVDARVSWPSIAGAARYEVTRLDVEAGGAEMPVATVLPPNSEAIDESVLEGVPLAYRVTVVAPSGCTSVGASTAVTAPARVDLDATLEPLDDARGNGNGISEPGEPLTLRLVVSNRGGRDATSALVRLTSMNPGVAVVPASLPLDDVRAGGTVESPPPHFTLTLDSALACGAAFRVLVEVESAEGCSPAEHAFALGREVAPVAVLVDDFEADSGWRVDPGGADPGLTGGSWERADPAPTDAVPDDDHTTATGVAAWVTDNERDPLQPSRPAAHDVDGGCTVLESPDYDLSGEPGLLLSYWLAGVADPAVGDALRVEASGDAGGAWATLDDAANVSLSWTETLADLDAVLGAPPSALRLRFMACDLGPPSIVEALVDDVAVLRRTFACDAPRAARLRLAGTRVLDAPADGAFGNGDGFADPGEWVRLAVSIENAGSATAAGVAGTLTLGAAPAGTELLDANARWPDLAPGAVAESQGEAPPHFLLRVPADSCGATIGLELAVTSDSIEAVPALAAILQTPVGAPDEVTLFATDFEADDGGFTHGASCAEPGCDEWEWGTPAGRSRFDPAAAGSGARAWGIDLSGDGDYEPGVTSRLDSPSIDCAGRTGVTLAFKQWLSVEDGAFDQARVLVAGAEAWRNPSGADLREETWVSRELDIGPLADGLPSVDVSFELAADGGVERGGWTVDDFRVFTRERSCSAVDCASEPRPGWAGGVLRATGRKDGQGAEWDWPSLRPAPGLTLRLRRGTAAGSLADVITPAGFVGSSFDDRGAPGPLYFYRLKMVNCAGIEGPDAP